MMRQQFNYLKANQNRDSTKANYLGIWKQFNKFIIRLDSIPLSWEERATYFATYLVSCGYQSSTIRSYVSAIKHVVVSSTDNYQWQDEQILLSAIVRACKIKNDCLRMRLPIQLPLLETLLFELDREFATQPYLNILYKAMFALAY